jgi:hypothetical protein
VGRIMFLSCELRGTGNIKRAFKTLNSFGLEHRPVVGFCEYGGKYLGSVKRGMYLNC